MKPDGELAGGCTEQVKQLPLSRNQGGIRHVIDEANIDAIGKARVLCWPSSRAPLSCKEVMVRGARIDENGHQRKFLIATARATCEPRPAMPQARCRGCGTWRPRGDPCRRRRSRYGLVHRSHP